MALMGIRRGEREVILSCVFFFVQNIISNICQGASSVEPGSLDTAFK